MQWLNFISDHFHPAPKGKMWVARHGPSFDSAASPESVTIPSSKAPVWKVFMSATARSGQKAEERALTSTLMADGGRTAKCRTRAHWQRLSYHHSPLSLSQNTPHILHSIDLRVLDVVLTLSFDVSPHQHG